ncbi:hypothetical protein BpHYR1_012562 [Brachionus plicatilis]|uniref:Uncharacterized protein n=1 Tax=Brachionus plicatilis TaxID=10195 RepID=A0A3M7PIU2_BRAPC|nr:hypothetical protein BpHYR1_012562 [Brachionus plicatilis]
MKFKTYNYLKILTYISVNLVKWNKDELLPLKIGKLKWALFLKTEFLKVTFIFVLKVKFINNLSFLSVTNYGELTKKSSTKIEKEQKFVVILFVNKHNAYLELV